MSYVVYYREMTDSRGSRAHWLEHLDISRWLYWELPHNLRFHAPRSRQALLPFAGTLNTSFGGCSWLTEMVRHLRRIRGAGDATAYLTAHSTLHVMLLSEILSRLHRGFGHYEYCWGRLLFWSGVEIFEIPASILRLVLLADISPLLHAQNSPIATGASENDLQASGTDLKARYQDKEYWGERVASARIQTSQIIRYYPRMSRKLGQNGIGAYMSVSKTPINQATCEVQYTWA